MGLFPTDRKPTETNLPSVCAVLGGYKYDIRDVVVKCATDEDVVQSLHSLPASEKYAYLHHHVKHEDSFTFPTTFTGGCNRDFLARWLKEHAWLCYSIKLDFAFCMPCALWSGSGVAVNGKLVTSPFLMWQKK